MNIPIILLLNMSDLVNTDAIVDCEKLRNQLNIFKVIPFSAAKKTGFNQLKSAIEEVIWVAMFSL